MAKITINEIDYYTDDFNEEQQKAYAEIQLVSAELNRMDYVSAVLLARRNTLGGMIAKLAEETPIEAEDAS